MKTRISNRVRFLYVLCWAVSAVGLRASGQTPAGLAIQTYAGLTITGAVGTIYSIEYVTDLAQLNDPNAWRCLEFLQLPASPYLWADRSAVATGNRFYRAVVSSGPANMVFIPPGTFRMGSPTNEPSRETGEGPQTAVTISRGYWIGKYEVTQGEYLAVMGSNPSLAIGDTNRPVESLYWEDATNYCARLTQQERVAGRIGTNCVFRLPTEAEWEYACRAWTSTRYSHGDDPDYTSLANYAWYAESINVGGPPRPVGQKLPNQWGLYDMHGNVWELCSDWWSESLPGGIVLDYQGPANGEGRVIRGGGAGGFHTFDVAGICRSASRYFFGLDIAHGAVGFRVVLAPGQP